MSTNQQVDTPIGKGFVQGGFLVVDGNQQVVTHAVLVRLPINDVTRGEMNKSNCLTPRATLNGLWIFSSKDLK